VVHRRALIELAVTVAAVCAIGSPLSATSLAPPRLRARIGGGDRRGDAPGQVTRGDAGGVVDTCELAERGGAGGGDGSGAAAGGGAAIRSCAGRRRTVRCAALSSAYGGGARARLRGLRAFARHPVTQMLPSTARAQRARFSRARSPTVAAAVELGSPAPRLEFLFRYRQL